MLIDSNLSIVQQSIATMSAYVPSMTLPSMLFEQPAAAILLPVALGTAVGFSNKRESLEVPVLDAS